MDAVAGWATSPEVGDGLAHEVFHEVGGVAAGDDPADLRTLCGQFNGAYTWELAGPGVERCQSCQSLAAGTPD